MFFGLYWAAIIGGATILTLLDRKWRVAAWLAGFFVVWVTLWMALRLAWGMML